jgi:hypothetical protein
VPVLAAAAIVFALSTLGLALRVEPVPTWYYHLAWWSYIVAADDVNRRVSGRSLLRDRPAHFAWLAGVSVLWWTLFELVNLRLGNWYYVMSLPWTPLRWAGGVLAFASVLPGIVETLALVENLPPALRARPPAGLVAGEERTVITLGAASPPLPLVCPDTSSRSRGEPRLPAGPWNRRHARRASCATWRRARPPAVPHARGRAHLRRAVGPGTSGRTKWMYTVPASRG